MIKEAIDSFWENLKERTTNPFLGTLLIVWTIHNWQLVYGLFTFDPKTTQQTKISFINTYFKEVGFLSNLFCVVWYTIITLSITYLLLNISRLIINFYEKTVTPWVFKITDSKSVVLRTEYDKLNTAYRLLEERLETERQNKNKAIQEAERYSEELYEFKHPQTIAPIKAENFDTSYDVLGANQIQQNESIDLQKLFPGKWKNEFIFLPTGKIKEEIFEIKNGNHFFVGNTAWFSIDDVAIDQDNRILKFTKNGLSTNKGRVLHNALNIIEYGKKYEGIEDTNHKVIYTRIN